MTAPAPKPRLAPAPNTPVTRAPSQAAWDATTPAQRAALVSALPLSPPDAHKLVPEGDDHVDGAVGTHDTLRMLHQTLVLEMQSPTCMNRYSQLDADHLDDSIWELRHVLRDESGDATTQTTRFRVKRIQATGTCAHPFQVLILGAGQGC